MLTNQEINRLDDYLTCNNTVKCDCGHSITITNKHKRLICSWCGNYVYLHKKDEFKNKLKEVMKK